jgi:DnaK suppressor protein
MNDDTRGHLTELRDLLTHRRQELRVEVRAADRQRRDGGVAVAASEVTDRKDEAGQRQLSEVGDAEQQRDIDELAQVERALQRLDAGTYGDCAHCGEPIALQRLQVQPAAERCAPCQANVERVLQRGRFAR